MQYFHCLITFIFVLSTAFFLSEDKKNIKVKIIASGILIQFLMALVIFKIPTISSIFLSFNHVLEVVSGSTTKAVSFVFGGLANPPEKSGLGFILALQGFPILITISALSAILTYWRILPFIINIFSIIFRKLLNIGGTLGFAVSVNMFSGMSETPLIINNYLKRLTHSELFSLMTCGTAAVASSVMVLYSIILKPVIENPITHIVSSVLISIPASLAISRIIIPETGSLSEGDDVKYSRANNTLDALYIGIMDGTKVIITIIAMLIGFVTLIDLCNELIISVNPTAYDITIQRILGFCMSPIVWLMGIPLEESVLAGSLLGTKIVINEIVSLQELVKVASELSERSKIMMIYVLSSFANLGSIGVMIGIYSSLVPERRSEVIKLGLKSVIAGVLVNISTASIAGIFI